MNARHSAAVFLFLLLAHSSAFAVEAVRSYDGFLVIPTYEHSARELEPPLFSHSSLAGMYPFTTFLMPYKPGPVAKKYAAIFVENEYLKLTYIPEFGGRFYSIFDKLRHREMLYRNDVVKPAPYNPRNSWPQSGMELTGPHDLHMLTLHGEPYWANQVVNHPDGSVALVLGEVDPVYGMDVSFSATLYPGVAAVRIDVSCYNGRDYKNPQMFWVNTAVAATPKTSFIYPMSRTVGHTTADIADWPVYNGTDYSVDRNNQHMLGVFGIDIYDNFQGAYQFDRDYGIFRFADRRIVQGMKLWTFGYGEGSKNFENGYTDKAGPYVELQSGRHVWDGHYEWVAPHSTESWSEWWIPVSQTGGLCTLTRDVALNLTPQPAAGSEAHLQIALAATRIFAHAKLVVTAAGGTLFERDIDLNPAAAYHTEVPFSISNSSGIRVRLVDAKGQTVLDYTRPDQSPGRKEYTPFTLPLEKAKKPPQQMGAEELVLAAEFRLKELDEPGAIELLGAALKLDPEYAKANTLWCGIDFAAGRYDHAVERCSSAIRRDPYADTAYYYLGMSLLRSGREAEAERNFYYIWPDSAYFGKREYQLGLLSLRRGDRAGARSHLDQALLSNGKDLLALLTLAFLDRKEGKRAAAEQHLKMASDLDPTNRIAATERWLDNSSPLRTLELRRLLGEQTQEAMQAALFYRNLNDIEDALKLLLLVDGHNRDPWGTTPEFYYTLAYYRRKLGLSSAADAALAQASIARGNVDRFPFREESEAPLEEAVRLRPQDVTARFELGCLLYFHKRVTEAIHQWEEAVSVDSNYFSTHRALGLAFAEQGYPVQRAADELERAVALNPSHISTLNDLSDLYARAGRFQDQLRVLTKAQTQFPGDDGLIESILAAYLNMGNYQEAQRLLEHHQFATHHRNYSLRDKYRILEYGLASQAFERRNYQSSLALFQAALSPPSSLAVDTFEGQSTPRAYYYLGRVSEAMGNNEAAHAAYTHAISGMDQLTGDRDSWNSENFFMVAALDSLGRSGDADTLEQHFAKFAETEKDSQNPNHRAEARYLLGLIQSRHGNTEEAKKLFGAALEAQPNLLAARIEIRGDSIAPTFRRLK